VSGARAIQLVEAGLWLRMSGDLEGARRLFEQALRLDPECDRARELLGTKPAAAEELPEELQNVPSSNTNLFAVPLPRLFPESMSEGPDAPTDPFIPLSMVPPLAPAYVPPPAKPLASAPPAAPPPRATPPPVTPARAQSGGTPPPAPPPRVATGRWTPLPAGAPRAPSGTGTPLPAAAPRAPSATPLPAVAPRPPSGTPLPAVAPRAPPATPLPAPAQRTPSPWAGRVPSGATPLPAVAPKAPSMEATPLPAPSTSTAAAAAAFTLPASLLTPAPLPTPAVVPLPEPASRSASAVATGQPSTVASDDWWTDGDSPPTPPKDAWEVGRPQPTTLPPSAATDTDTLNMVKPLPASAGGTPLPAQMPSDPRHEARMLLQRATELQELDDHSGARELLLEAQALDPEATEIERALAESEQTLQALYESKLGKLSVVPRVRLRDDEVIWLNLDHRAGFILAQIDGSLTFDDLFSVSGMSRLDTARILVQLLEQRVIVR